MHSLIHLEYVRADAAERLRRASRHPHLPPKSEPPPPPPPLRRRAAHVAGRLARRLDADAARRAVA